MSGDTDLEVYRPDEALALARSHLLGANLFGALVVAGLSWLAYTTQDKFGIAMAIIAGVSGYLSQLAGANWAWSGHEVWHGVMTGLILTAAAATLLGVISYFA